MPGSIRSVKFESTLARKKRRAFVTWLTVTICVLILILGSATYWLVGSRSFMIETTVVEGVQGQTKGDVERLLTQLMDSRLFGFIPTGRNMLLFPSSVLAAQLTAQAEQIREVVVDKEYPHTLRVIVTERVPFGTWCLRERCENFDETGTTFGRAIPSTGSLLVMIYDQRVREGDVLDRSYLTPLLSLIPLMQETGIAVRDYTIPADGVNEFAIHVQEGYVINISLDADLEDQVRAVKAFMDQKRQEDPAFMPAYVDARIPGRIYYQ